MNIKISQKTKNWSKQFSAQDFSWDFRYFYKLMGAVFEFSLCDFLYRKERLS